MIKYIKAPLKFKIIRHTDRKEQLQVSIKSFFKSFLRSYIEREISNLTQIKHKNTARDKKKTFKVKIKIFDAL